MKKGVSLIEKKARTNLYCLAIARSLRSFTQGYLNILFPIYLSQLHYGATTLGLILTFAGICRIRKMPYKWSAPSSFSFFSFASPGGELSLPTM